VIKAGILLDTGPLVALIDKTDSQHSRAKACFEQCLPPLRTSEAVITEACYLANKGDPEGAQKIVALGEQGLYQISFIMKDHFPFLRKLMKKYRDVAISLADACLIRCAEIYNESRILSFDSDFEFYRWGGNKKFQPLKP
jgi:predicted nucleic acid-binding protein